MTVQLLWRLGWASCASSFLSQLHCGLLCFFSIQFQFASVCGLALIAAVFGHLVPSLMCRLSLSECIKFPYG